MIAIAPSEAREKTCDKIKYDPRYYNHVIDCHKSYYDEATHSQSYVHVCDGYSAMKGAARSPHKTNTSQRTNMKRKRRKSKCKGKLIFIVIVFSCLILVDVLFFNVCVVCVYVRISYITVLTYTFLLLSIPYMRM